MSQEAIMPCALDRVTALVEHALGQARRTHAAILESVHPLLHPAKRLGAERAMRQLETSRLFRTEVLDELDALMMQVEREIAAGRSKTFRPHESDPSEGHVETSYDQRAAELTEALAELRALDAAITAVLDAVEARRVAATLLGSQ